MLFMMPKVQVSILTNSVLYIDCALVFKSVLLLVLEKTDFFLALLFTKDSI